MRKHFFIFILILSILLIFHCQSDKATWQGTIEDLDTVKVVKNPEEPLYGELVFDLKEDFPLTGLFIEIFLSMRRNVFM